MSVRNIFKEPFQQRLDSYSNKLLWADSSESDSVAYLNTYKVCMISSLIFSWMSKPYPAIHYLGIAKKLLVCVNMETTGLFKLGS